MLERGAYDAPTSGKEACKEVGQVDRNVDCERRESNSGSRKGRELILSQSSVLLILAIDRQQR